MEYIKHLLLRFADAINVVSETTTVDQTAQPQLLACTDGISKATPSETQTNPGTPMATFMKLSQVQQQQQQEPQKTIIETIHSFIQEERRQNYHFLGNQTHRCMNQGDLLNVSFEDGLYTFTEGSRYSFQRYVAIDVVPSPRSVLTINNLIVTESSSEPNLTPTLVTEWLKKTYTWDNTWELRDPEEQYEEQRIWWNNNTKTFPLLSLPAEMRDAVYLQIVGPVVLPDYDGQITLGEGQTHQKPRQGTQRDPDVHQPDITIMKISRQVRSEAIRVATRDATKRFRAIQSPVPAMCDLMGHLDVLARSGFLRVIQLEMTAKRYYEFIGISPTHGSSQQVAPGSRSVDTLRAFRNLSKLDFRFIGPKHKLAVCPWSSSATTLAAIHSCQKVWIHWFFVLVWTVLLELQVQKKVKITLSGCVKTSTRNYWQNIFNNSNRHDYTPSMKVLEWQITKDMEDLDGPIPCKCSTICGNDPAIRVVQWSEYEMREM